MALLCVNVDHVATVRQARRDVVPDPVEAGKLAEKAGAVGITMHLREDRRHVQDHDLVRMKKAVRGKLNMEMGAAEEILRVALRLKPDEATLVPEKRAELTTEGGLDVAGSSAKIASAVRRLKRAGITVSLFIDPDFRQVKAAAESGADTVELHTGVYANAFARGGARAAAKSLQALQRAAELARALRLRVNAGHGLTYANVAPVARLPFMEDLNIGHNIVARAVLVGMETAVKEMIKAIKH